MPISRPFTAARILSLRSLFIAALAVVACHAGAQSPPSAPRAVDPRALLAAAKAASGGVAWDSLRSQHSEVNLAAAGLEGSVERWSDIMTGRSMLRYSIGPLTGAAGFDGNVVWTQDGLDPPKVETGAVARELAANAAYRDRLAFWYPVRAKAVVTFKGREEADGQKFEIVTIVPEGGRAFEFWIHADSGLIERLVEREAEVTRTEIYTDRRDVQGVKIPFHVRTTRGDPKFDEIVTVQKLNFNTPMTEVVYGIPVDAAELTFPVGSAAVEAPFEMHSGHLFVRVLLDGRGPFRMLLDSGGANVLTTRTVQSLAGAGKPVPQSVDVRISSINGVELGGQRYVVADIDAFLERVEGLDDIAGIIGLEWFVRMPIRIDYAKGRLTFHDPAQFKGDRAGTRVPVAARGRLPQVRGSIDGVEGAFEIDTGSRASLTLLPAFATKNNLSGKMNAKIEAITGAGLNGPVRSLLGRGKMLKLGTVDVPFPVVAIPLQAAGPMARADLAGNVGFGILRQFAVTYDLPNDAIYFERYINYGTPDIADRGGVWLELAADGFKVVDVVAAGPAAQAGLKTGDVIVEVNGRAWSELTLPVVRDILRGTPGVRVRVKTGGGTEGAIVLRDLV